MTLRAVSLAAGMARGRPPKPTSLKLVQGNPGKRDLNTAEPDPKPVALPAPGFLNGDAKAAWQRLMPHLVQWGLFSAMDRGALAV